MDDRIRCSRCEETLEPEAFAPSHRRDGNWCRPCRKAYMAERNGPQTCKDCGAEYERWSMAKHPGAAGRRCRDCYNAYCRNRDSYRSKRKSTRAQRTLQSIPEYGPPGGSRAWQQLREAVIAEESICGLCGEPVNKTLTGAMGPSVDHIMPIEWGGSNRRYNLQLAHRGCNSKAGRQMQDVRAAVARSALWIDRRMSTNL